MEINNILKENKTVLAPMAGVNCTSFRLLCRRYDAGLLYTQMYDVNTIVEKNNDNTLANFLNIRKEESPIALQLIGNVNDPWEESIKIAEKYTDIIDINLGCIESDFLGKKSGAYLLQHPDQIKRIINKCISSTDKPVTAKIRSGWNNDSINAVEIAKLLEKQGISAISVHPRTKKERYTGKADWNIIKQVKQNTSIPIIGNGDITMPGHAKAMIEQTNCDAVMIGRAARKNPFIFTQINYLLEHGKNITEQPNKEKIKQEFLQLYKKYEKRQSDNEVKDHLNWLSKRY